MADIDTLKRINEALAKLNKQRQQAKLAQEQLKDEERQDEEATKLAMSMAMNEALVQELKEVRAEIAKGANVSVNAPDVNVSVPDVVVPDIKIPEIKVPEVKLPKIPEIKIPKITVPKAQVDVKIPEIKLPDIPAPVVNMEFPDAMALKGIDKKCPLPVLMMGSDGKPFQMLQGGGGGISKTTLQESNATIGKVLIAGQDNATVDAFVRQRVSEPTTIFDSKQIHDNQPLFWDDAEVSGAGTSTVHSQATASTVMTVADSTAGKRVRQTFQRFNYQPGKSQLIFMTGTLSLSGAGEGITAGMGLFDDDNGFFIKADNGTLYCVKRSSTSGAAVDTEVPQSSWNLDTMDGNGPSGVTLDPTKSQILILDYEWLGVGRARMGFVIDGLVIYFHQFVHANLETGVYMSTPNLPLRYEIENDGTGGDATLEHICSTVISEGGVQTLGILRHTDSGAITNLGNANSYAIIGIRLKGTALDATVLMENIAMIASANDQLHWELRLNPTVAGTFTYSDQDNSTVQIATGSNSNTISGGTEIDGGYLTTTIPIQSTVPNAIRLGSLIDGTPDEIVLIATPITNNITVRASITWRELS